MFAKELRRQLAVCCVWTAVAFWLPACASVDLNTASHCLEDAAGGKWTVQTTVNFEAPTLKPESEVNACANTQTEVFKNNSTVKQEETTPESADESGYIRYDGVGTYKLHRERVRWSNAKQRCEEEDAYLAIINSREEERIIRKIIIEYMDAFDFVFIGINDIEVEGEFRTVHGDLLTSVGYTNWASGEPNNYGYFGEDCGSVIDSGQISDADCDKPSWFLCERPL